MAWYAIESLTISYTLPKQKTHFTIADKVRLIKLLNILFFNQTKWQNIPAVNFI